MNFNKRMKRNGFAVAAVCSTALLSPAFADQAKWASQYFNWQLTDTSITEIWNIDQQVWIPKSDTASFWPLVWTWQGASEGGYLGLQERDDSADQNARFSIWNATEAQGPNCRTFDGEGIGYTCEIAVTIDTSKYYRLRLWRTESAADGQWWGGWLIEEDGSGGLVEHYIGQIKAPQGRTSVDTNAINNFVEYFGQAVSPCSGVPMSIAAFTPPAVNYHGKGTGVYGGYTRFGGSSPAAGNICKTGTEADGAEISYDTFDFGFAEGIVVFTGGSASQHVLTAKAPPDMPDS